ncbi:HAD-IA family hydrolase [Streptomyces sp. ISL-1]|uniref:HAD family hydrolase n=1 Tax=Streptomyces sp. ISL-1 TaxID=2817657 RepID=UPI001BE9711A|nr:HAD-IA family hydrolase [Streptomyces sp. ISL-1]MBT2388028.1 HAD-IA family hydrolase [Streptomyces sp. ISL-1]
MTDLGRAFLRSGLGHPPADAEMELLVLTFLSEWDRGVRHLPGLPDLLADLAAEYRLVVVSNTQDTVLVPGHLEAMGIRHRFETVVTSLDVGWRKPHPKIYPAVLRRLRIDPAAAVFVGDTYVADYQGPAHVGMRALLIDPCHEADIHALIGERTNVAECVRSMWVLDELPGRYALQGDALVHSTVPRDGPRPDHSLYQWELPAAQLCR